MISTIDRYKRIFSLIALFLVLFIAAAGILEQELELTGVLTIAGAFFTLAYLPISWLLKRFKYLQFTLAWMSKEIWVVLVTVGLLSIIGGIESYFINSSVTVLFAIPFFAVLFLGTLHFRNEQIRKQGISLLDKQMILRWAFGCFAIGTFLLLIVLEHYDNQDALAITGVSYFSILFFLILRWVFRQVRGLINLKNEQVKTELLHLKSQVNPHFFFNMLNNLYGLVGKDAEKARELILKLSDMMRYSIYEGQKEEVTLEAELDYLNNYIELHKMRYHKEIKVEFNSAIDEKGIKLMPLLFIILLENAFKHGVEKLRKNAFIKVDLITKPREVYFSVENNFDTSASPNLTGIGLKNLKRRLELVYPKKHQLSFSINQETYKAALTIKQ